MFHTLFELQEKEKKEKINPKPNKKYNIEKSKSPEDNYYGKGNKAYDHYNKKKAQEKDAKFENTKNKIKLEVYQNGFIVNNGQFRDRSIPENQKFMEEVEKGNIPEEIMDKGITDLGILLVNRKTEIYYPPISAVPITHITQITQINPINPITVNPFNQYNQYNQINQFSQKPDIFSSYQYQQYPIQYQYPYQFQNPYDIINNPFGYTVDTRPRSRTEVSGIPPQTPIGTRNVRKEIFIPTTENRNGIIRKDRLTSSVPKKGSKNKNKTRRKSMFQTFHNFQQMEFQKEEEEKMKKQKEKEIQRDKIKNMNKPEEKKNDEKENEKEKDEKKFIAFGGIGKTIGNVHIEGLNVNKEIKNIVDVYKPICSIDIRLFNGEILKCDFNYTQTLRDIYYHVRNISGSNNFTLLEGFPPRPLLDFDKTIGQLKLGNTILTQRIN